MADDNQTMTRKERLERDRKNLSEAEQLVEKAKREYVGENYHLAISFYYQALDLLDGLTFPRDLTSRENSRKLQSEIYNYRGRAYHKKEEYDLAIQDHNKAIAINSDNEYFHYNLGNAHVKKGGYDLAIQAFDKAININPKNAHFHFRVGNAYYKKADYSNAVISFDEAIRLDNSRADFHSNRGSANYEWGNYAEALDDFNSALQQDPNHANAYCGIGNVYYKKGDHDNAITNFNTATQKDIDQVDAYFGLGNILYERELYEEAIRNFDEAIKRDPTKALFHHKRAVAIVEKSAEETKKEVEKLIDDFEKEKQKRIEEAQAPSQIIQEYENRETSIKTQLIWKESWLIVNMLLILASVILFEFLRRGYFLPAIVHNTSASFMEKWISNFPLFFGFGVVLYMLLSELRRRRNEVKQYQAAREDAFRKKIMARYNFFFADEEKRFELVKQATKHTTEKSPAEFILGLQLDKKKQKKDDRHLLEEISEKGGKIAKGLSKSGTDPSG